MPCNKLTTYLILIAICSIFFACSRDTSKIEKANESQSIKKPTTEKNTQKDASNIAPQENTDSWSEGSQLIVYYFRRNIRCASCMYIEETTQSTIKEVYADQINNGEIVFTVINTDNPEHAHYEKDYQLYAQSVVLSEMNEGRELRWTNLEKVWQLLNNDQKFKEYIVKEINKFLE